MFIDALDATFNWFFTVDDGFRFEAVDLCGCMLRYSLRHEGLDVPEKMLEHVRELAEKGEVLSEEERRILLNWREGPMEEVVEETGTVNPKTDSWILMAKEKKSRQRSGNFARKTSSSIMSKLPCKVIPQKRPNDQTLYEPSTIIIPLSPSKPPRKLQRLDLPDTQPHVFETALQLRKSYKPLGDISALHKQLLSWSYPPTTIKGIYPPNFDERTLTGVPAKFSDTREYSSVFEPLLVLECWEQYNHACEETRGCDAVRVGLSDAVAVDGFYGKTIDYNGN